MRHTGYSCKADIADLIIIMEKISAVQDEAEECEASYSTRISYITDEVKAALKSLPTFGSVMDWKKDLKGVLKNFIYESTGVPCL